MEQLTQQNAQQDDRLTSQDWALILGVSERHIRRACGGVQADGRIPRSALSRSPGWQDRVSEAMLRHRARDCHDLAAILRTETPGWTPPRHFAKTPTASRQRADHRRTVLGTYYAALPAGEAAATREAIATMRRLFPATANTKRDSLERNLRRWLRNIEARGGWRPDARPEIFLDNRACDHPRARLRNRVPHELIAAFRAKCLDTARVSDAIRAFEIDWLAGRPVPGLGVRQDNEPWPFRPHQMRHFAPPKAERVLAHMGKARARATVLPHITTTTARLRPAEIYMLDDTRIDVVATNDLTGHPTQLKAYIMMDLATRRIVGWTVVEGNILARHVTALLVRVLRSTGIGRDYPTTIIFERGTVSCAPAQQTLIESCFPGRILIARTGMDGGRNHPGDFIQAASGHWMGKGHQESLNRTFTFFIGHLPGQRGNIYQNQPAALGLTGYNRITGALDYTNGSRIHDAALLTAAERAIEYQEDDLAQRISNWQADNCHQENGRLIIEALRPVSWVLRAITESVAYYNARTDHRLEGFRRVEYQCPKTHRLLSRMESPDERAQWLATQYPTDRLAAADAAMLLHTSARSVTITRQGVSFDISGQKFRFWSPDSPTIHEAMSLEKGARKCVALYDREGLLQGTANEIHLLTDTAPIPRGAETDWQGGPARLLESLPLAEAPDRNDPEALAKHLAKAKRVESRIAAELVRDAAPYIAKRLASAQANTEVLREARSVTVTRVHTGAETVKSAIRMSHTGHAAPPPAAPPTTREAQREAAEPDYIARLAAAQISLRENPEEEFTTT